MTTVESIAGVAALSAIATASLAFTLLVSRSRMAHARARGYSAAWRIMLLGCSSIVLFAGLGFAWRGVGSGTLRWILALAGICMIGVAVAILWTAFGVAFAWDSGGITIIGPFNCIHLNWSSIAGVQWSASRGGFVLVGGGRRYGLPWNRKALEEFMDEIRRRPLANCDQCSRK